MSLPQNLYLERKFVPKADRLIEEDSPIATRCLPFSLFPTSFHRRPQQEAVEICRVNLSDT